MLKLGVFDKIFIYCAEKLIKMLIIGKNMRNQTNKKWIAYVVKAGPDPLTRLPDGQRPAKA